MTDPCSPHSLGRRTSPPLLRNHRSESPQAVIWSVIYLTPKGEAQNIWLLLIYLAAALALGCVARHFFDRSQIGWTILGLCFTPLISLVFLVVAGPPWEPPADAQSNAARDEAKWAEQTRPSCGNQINLSTRAGLESPAIEPWRIICNNCREAIDGRELG